MKNLSLFFIVFLLIQLTTLAQVNQVWAAEFNGSGNSVDYSYAMVVDQSGNTYVTGETYTTAGNYDCVTIKYNSDGDTVWVRYYNGPANSRDIGRAIAVDVGGNVYVTGASYGSDNFDIVSIAYNSAGVLQWAARYDGPANGADGGAAITTDASGNVYVTGYSDGDVSPVFRQDDYVTIKYNSSGTADWVKQYDGPSNYHDIPYAIAVDMNNNVYVTGGSSNVGTRYDYATVKYSPAGSELWVARYNPTTNNEDIAKAIVVDGSGNIFVTGSSDGSSLDNPDYATIKYNSDGIQQWLSRYDGAVGGDNAYALVLDGSGNIYVTGESRSPAAHNSYDYLTIRYDASSGDTIWTARYNGPGDNTDISLSIAADLLGNVYVTGYSRGNGTANDYATLKYNSTGSQQRIIRYNGSGNGDDFANTVAVDTIGNVYITGSSVGTGTADDIVTIKYSQTPNSVHESRTNLPENYFLYQNYPNPFNPSTTIKYQIPELSFVTLKVYDLLGNEIAALVNEEKLTGTYEITWNAVGLPSGIYFYKLQAGSFIETKKMVLLR